MASVHKEIAIDAPPELVWDALRDWGAVHERLVPGFVTDARLEGDARIVTFFNGAVARELLVDLDDSARRLVWSVVGGPMTHHNASAQVLADGERGTRFVWIADLLPHELGPYVEGMVERGIGVVKETLEAAAAQADASSPRRRRSVGRGTGAAGQDAVLTVDC
jgi:carbon monoxide dehydrogenase subunit G